MALTWWNTIPLTWRSDSTFVLISAIFLIFLLLLVSHSFWANQLDTIHYYEQKYWEKKLKEKLNNSNKRKSLGKWKSSWVKLLWGYKWWKHDTSWLRLVSMILNLKSDLYLSNSATHTLTQIGDHQLISITFN